MTPSLRSLRSASAPSLPAAARLKGLEVTHQAPFMDRSAAARTGRQRPALDRLEKADQRRLAEIRAAGWIKERDDFPAGVFPPVDRPEIELAG